MEWPKDWGMEKRSGVPRRRETEQKVRGKMGRWRGGETGKGETESWGEPKGERRTLRHNVTEQGRCWGPEEDTGGGGSEARRRRREGGNAGIQADLGEENSLTREGTRILGRRPGRGVPWATERDKVRNGTWWVSSSNGCFWGEKRCCREVEKRERERDKGSEAGENLGGR